MVSRDHALAGQEPRWTAVASVRAGSEDGPGALVNVFDVEIGPNGEMLAGQPTVATIAVFDADGRYLRSIGRRGQGPGEFQIVGGMGWAGDTLWVVDIGRLHLFDARFEFARTITFPTLRPPPGVTRIMPGPILADGSMIGIPMMVDSGRAAPVVRVSQSGVITDTLAHVAMRDAFTRISVAGAARPGNVQRPWVDDPLWTTSPDGRAVVVVERPLATRAGDASFTILRIGLNGDTLFRRAVRYAAVERTDAETDAWYAAKATQVAHQVSATEAAAERAIRRAVRPPRHHLPVTRLVVGRDGTIWLRREDTAAEAVDWQVFDATGAPLGRVALPSGYDLRRAQIDRVWGIEKDALDVPFARVYTIDRARY